jgi:hypothetical protein
VEASEEEDLSPKERAQLISYWIRVLEVPILLLLLYLAGFVIIVIVLNEYVQLQHRHADLFCSQHDRHWASQIDLGRRAAIRHGYSWSSMISLFLD